MIINCLMMNLTNEYGSSFGTEYIFFPEEALTKEELQEKIKTLTNRVYSNIYRNPFGFFCNKLDTIQVSNDVWSQSHTSEASSINDAIIRYFKES